VHVFHRNSVVYDTVDEIGLTSIVGVEVLDARRQKAGVTDKEEEFERSFKRVATPPKKAKRAWAPAQSPPSAVGRAAPIASQ